MIPHSKQKIKGIFEQTKKFTNKQKTHGFYAVRSDLHLLFFCLTETFNFPLYCILDIFCPILGENGILKIRKLGVIILQSCFADIQLIYKRHSDINHKQNDTYSKAHLHPNTDDKKYQ